MPATTAVSFQQDIAHLQRVGLFQGIAPDALARIAQAARRRQISAGTFLFHQGDPAEMIYIPVAPVKPTFSKTRNSTPTWDRVKSF